MIQSIRHKSRALLLLLLAVVLLVVGFAPATAQAKTELVYGIDNNVDTLDPNITSYSSVGIILGMVVEPLIWQNPLGTFHPGLATDWTVNADATEYTFHLRKDVKFQDGTPFNAEAVKFTFDRIVNPDNKSQTAVSLIGPYKETDVVDDYTAVVKFSAPFAPFLDSASQPYLGIVSPTAVQSMGADFGQKTVVGTGPFKIASYVPDSEIDLVRNDDYNWGSKDIFGITGPSALTKITFKIVQEPSTRTAALESGDADFIDDVSPTDYDNLKDSGSYTMVELTQPGHGWSLMMNEEKAPTDDLQVRKAIALASDKAGMLATVFNGFGTTGCSPLTKVMFGYDPDTCNYLPYDPDQAGKILDADGWTMNASTGVREKNGTPLTIEHYFRADSPVTAAMATFMQADLAKVGIQVNLNGLSQSGYFDAVRAGKHNTQNWWDTQTDPDGVVRTLFSSANAGGGTNRSNYKSDAMDKLIDQGAGTADLTQRVAIYKQIQKLADDDAVMVYYVDPYLLFGGVTNLTGIQFLGGGTLPNFYGASFGS